MAVSVLKRSMAVSSPNLSISQMVDGRMVITFAANPSALDTAVKQLIVSSTYIAVDLWNGTRKTLNFPT